MIRVTCQFLRPLPGLFLYAGLTAAGGCAVPGPDAELHWHQPQLEGRQRDVDLLSRTVTWAPDGRFERLLAEMPLPGAMAGHPTYILYLRWPASGGTLAVGRPGSPAPARGFVIQTRGQQAGLAIVSGGTLIVRGSSRSRTAIRRLEVDLTCEDGTRMRGKLRARRDDWNLHEFETYRRPADVEAMALSPEPG